MTVVAASELIDGDNAAATMAATMKPEIALRQRGDHEQRQHFVGATERAWQRRVLIEREQHRADDEEQHELREHQDSAQDQAG